MGSWEENPLWCWLSQERNLHLQHFYQLCVGTIRKHIPRKINPFSWRNRNQKTCPVYFKCSPKNSKFSLHKWIPRNIRHLILAWVRMYIISASSPLGVKLTPSYLRDNKSFRHNMSYVSSAPFRPPVTLKYTKLTK